MVWYVVGNTKQLVRAMSTPGKLEHIAYWRILKHIAYSILEHITYHLLEHIANWIFHIASMRNSHNLQQFYAAVKVGKRIFEGNLSVLVSRTLVSIKKLQHVAHQLHADRCNCNTQIHKYKNTKIHKKLFSSHPDSSFCMNNCTICYSRNSALICMFNFVCEN